VAYSKEYIDAVQRDQQEQRLLKPWALITGATGGLGQELAMSFAHADYNILIHSRSQERALELKARLDGVNRLQGGVLTSFAIGDLSKPGVVDRVIEQALGKKISLLVNNAGVYMNEPAASSPAPIIRHMLEVNLLAPLLLSLGCLAVLKERQGIIVNINSLAAHGPKVGESVYAAGKAGLEGFSKAFKMETMPVRVMDVFLGAMKTPMSDGRPDQEKMIQPREAASAIVAAVQSSRHGHSLRFDSLDLRRSQY
jgi:short-subunit dehydrogenase